ncbi:alpha-mannosidase [Spirillospora sp. NPDC048911]|uniref:glycoside hydrolase family 38 N-terminal domain-containing protein n=1 Tax=Spirillospora sp. NPDC048911 TaxID=3364527 RepID=UPI0037187D30
MRMTQATETSIVVVPHTHWDREWYLPFQRFRLRLVALLDEVIDRMEADPRQHFTLDGQMAAVDDYLEIRPERRERVAALVREGRLAVGPWQILHDEFLCSGENIVRNLELGLRRAEELGAAMRVGYLPDQFGHCAQTPQILRLAGIEHACVWRGVPSAVRTHTFAWESPDGTAIRTEYLPEGGYGNAASMFEEAGQYGDGREAGIELLPGRVADFTERMRAWRPEGGPLLAMYGSDHTAPASDLADQIDGLGGGARLDTLAGYMATQDTSTEGLPRVRGELRSHARANILPGVISARAHLKQAMSRAERLVERYAEPLDALWWDGSAASFLDMAWTRLIEVSCHDSVTGCGSDETAEQVAARMAEAEQLGRAVCDLVTAGLAATVPFGGHLVFNPTPARRAGFVVLDVAAEGEIVLEDATGRTYPTQTLDVAATTLDDAVHAASDLPMVLNRVFGRSLFGQDIRDWTVSDRTLTFHVTQRADTPFDIADVREAVRDAEGEWRVVTIADPRRTVAALVEAPPLGVLSVRPISGTPTVERPVRAEGDDVLDNGLLRVQIAGDGTFSVRSAEGLVVEGLGRVMEGGDLGDTYNYAPPRLDRLVDTPDSVQVRAVTAGPLVAAFDVLRTYRWPAKGDLADDARSEAEEPVTVTMRVELRTGEPYVRLTVSFDNRCEDHRVRLHLPLPRQASSSFAEGQFAIVERGLTAEGGCGEAPLPTFPASAFVAAGGLAALLEHVTEYEVTGDGRELALTLVRSVGYLSRHHNANRDQPAGPQLPTPQAQCRGERKVELAIMPYSANSADGGNRGDGMNGPGGAGSAGSANGVNDADDVGGGNGVSGAGDRPGPSVLAAAESYRHGLLAAAGYGASSTPLPPARPGIEVTGEGVVMSSLRERDGELEVRLIAEHPVATTATISGGVTRPMRPWEIAAIRLPRP